MENSMSKTNEISKLREFDVDKLSYEDLMASLIRAKEESAEPFKFLNSIVDNVKVSRIVPTDTDIDVNMQNTSEK